MSAPRHDTPHPHAPRGFVAHGWVERISPKGERPGRWACHDCGVPHEYIDVPADHPSFVPDCPSSWLVAVEARPCPKTFETPCEHCGRCFECAPDCAGMAMVLGGMIPGVHVAGVPPVKPGDA